MEAKPTGKGGRALSVLIGGRAAAALQGQRRGRKGLSPSTWADLVEAARREWLACRAYFNSVTDPELVDHAIFSVQAAERKYMYLLRRARDARLPVVLEGERADASEQESRQAPDPDEGATEAAEEI